MRLTVNGVQVRVVDRIEIVLEVPEGGDTILNGVEIIARGGGPLRIETGSKTCAMLMSCEGLTPDEHGVKLYLDGPNGLSLETGIHDVPEAITLESFEATPGVLYLIKKEFLESPR